MHPNHTNYKVIISMASFTPSSILNSLVLICVLCSLWSSFASKGEETGKCDSSSFLSFKGNEKVTYLSLVHKNAPSSLFFQGGKGKNRSESDEKREMLIPSRYKDGTTMDIYDTTGSNYLVKVCLGGQEIKLSVDTGSVLTWTQCNCKDDGSYCYYQVDESFDSSKNFEPYQCPNECPRGPGVETKSSIEEKCREHLSVEGLNQQCSQKEECKYHDQNKISKEKCLYTNIYADGSSTSGVLGRATLNLGEFNDKILFGCGNKNNGRFSHKEDGILGLRYDKTFSIIRQTEGTYHRKFSYCIPQDNHKHGFLRLGHESNSEQANKEAMEVGRDGLYVVKLKGIKIGLDPVHYANKFVIVDSGTTFTRLPNKLFTEFKKIYGKAMADTKKGYVKVEDDCLKPDGLKEFEECYEIKEEPFEAPRITFLFGSTNVILPSKGITVQKDSIACLAFLERKEPMETERVIWGSYQQKGIEINFDVGDEKARTIWFNKLDDCKPKILGGNNVPL
ncbi:hypothetical protein L6164_023592 [Bauhinia variegata]|uniref:Uncharacterized protein n=1 Tax=Bauhinia variegata TaxID=167791 RepID=A0ACB9MKQ9_BAUVA|nr:hypothetical protein L6164_023592 [Bauhinia variegata]